MKLNTTNANTDRGKVLLKIYWIFKNTSVCITANVVKEKCLLSSRSRSTLLAITPQTPSHRYIK